MGQNLLFTIGLFLISMSLQAQDPGAMFPHLSDVLMVASPDADGKIEVPEHVWTEAAEAGAIEVRFRPSREIRARQSPPLTLPLISSPLIEIKLQEDHRHSWFLTVISGDTGEMKPVSVQRMISHLKPHWYHLIVTWEARTGRTELYLNGVLQVNTRDRETWEPLTGAVGPIHLGGWEGDGRRKTGIEVTDVSIRRGWVDEETARARAMETGLVKLDGEGRTIYDTALDVSELQLELIYEADFDRPLRMIHEEDLFEGEHRVREPSEDVDWVLESSAEVKTVDGRLVVDNHSSHIVLWNIRIFSGDFLLEFTMKPVNPDQGLAIVFFCAESVEGESIFAPGLPKRAGDFDSYIIEGHVNSYHASYMATHPPDEQGIVQPRRTTNLRKNDNAYMVAVGDDRVTGNGEVVNRIRLLKQGNRIRLEVNEQIVIAYDDEERLYGSPVWGEGLIGLRQMEYTDSAEYETFRVYKVK